MSVTARISLPVERRVVLVADDEDAILDVVRRVVVRLGLVPLTVHDGAAVVEVAATCQRLLLCAILDVQMPILNGADAAHAIHRLAPHIPIVLMSGAVPQSLIPRIAELPTAAILHKPFPLAALRDVLVRLSGDVQEGKAVAVNAQTHAMETSREF